MSAVLTVSMLLAGGLVLPEGQLGSLPLHNEQQSPAMVKIAPLPSRPSTSEAAPAAPRTVAGQPRAAPEPNQEQPAQPRTLMPAVPSAPMVMPLAPTDPAARVSPQLPWTPTSPGPTAASPFFNGMPPAVAGAAPGLSPPLMPNTWFGGQLQPNQPFDQTQAIINRAATARQPAFYPGTPSGDRAFANYRLPSPVSPYLNIYRREAAGSFNYYTLVRPELEQRTLNQRFSGELGGLSNSLSRQSAELQQLNRQNQALQGAVNSGNYINYQQYYNYYWPQYQRPAPSPYRFGP